MAIDDEPLALRQLNAYLEKVPYFEMVGCCRSALEAARLMETEPTDVLFIDINMPDLNGLDFVRSLSHPPLVVFTTAYHEYAIDGYKVNAVDYLLKPFGMADVMRAADKVKRQYELLKAAERLGDGYVESLQWPTLPIPLAWLLLPRALPPHPPWPPIMSSS